jgi:hypothetical protein
LLERVGEQCVTRQSDALKIDLSFGDPAREKKPLRVGIRTGDLTRQRRCRF